MCGSRICDRQRFSGCQFSNTFAPIFRYIWGQFAWTFLSTFMAFRLNFARLLPPVLPQVLIYFLGKSVLSVSTFLSVILGHLPAHFVHNCGLIWGQFADATAVCPGKCRPNAGLHPAHNRPPAAPCHPHFNPLPSENLWILSGFPRNRLCVWESSNLT